MRNGTKMRKVCPLCVHTQNNGKEAGYSSIISGCSPCTNPGIYPLNLNQKENSHVCLMTT